MMQKKFFLIKYNLWNKDPKNIQKYINIDLGTENKKPETPKEGDPIFKNVKNTLIGSNLMCLQHLKIIVKKKLNVLFGKKYRKGRSRII